MYALFLVLETPFSIDLYRLDPNQVFATRLAGGAALVEAQTDAEGMNLEACRDSGLDALAVSEHVKVEVHLLSLDHVLLRTG
jgi:hypothetical protein